ncbi:MAG TPA: hypothetical protein VHX37_15955 [Acidobacteriaceae bacterium]|jgi:hypothetical protein|nr:hypothetical protein [Acidobacteriaceae bacterium]
MESQSATQRPGSEADRTLDLVSYGVPFQLAAEDASLLGRMRQSAPFGSLPCPDLPAGARRFTLRATAPCFQVLGDEELLAQDETLDFALELLGGHLTVHVAEHAPDYVFVHAGVVAWQDRALLLPGMSFAGKSTLVAELVRAGATYYSDEFALIDRDGRVHPFPRDLRMRRPGAPEQTPVSIEELRGRAGTAALPVHLVVFTEFAEGSRWAPEPLSSGRAALEMLLHTAPVKRTPARVMATFSALMRHAQAWRSRRGEAAVTASALLASLANGGALA